MPPRHGTVVRATLYCLALGALVLFVDQWTSMLQEQRARVAVPSSFDQLRSAQAACDTIATDAPYWCVVQDICIDSDFGLVLRETIRTRAVPVPDVILNAAPVGSTQQLRLAPQTVDDATYAATLERRHETWIRQDFDNLNERPGRRPKFVYRNDHTLFVVGLYAADHIASFFMHNAITLQNMLDDFADLSAKRDLLTIGLPVHEHNLPFLVDPLGFDVNYVSHVQDPWPELGNRTPPDAGSKPHVGRNGQLVIEDSARGQPDALPGRTICYKYGVIGMGGRCYHGCKHGLPSQHALRTLRDTFLTRVGLVPEKRHLFKRRTSILVVQQEASNRIANLADVTTVLHSLGVHLEVVAFASMSLVEQIQIVHHHCVIVAPHGSGIINALWMTPGCAVVELFNAADHGLGLFDQFLASAEIHHEKVLCRSHCAKTITSVDADATLDIHVDPHLLRIGLIAALRHVDPSWSSVADPP